MTRPVPLLVVAATLPLLLTACAAAASPASKPAIPDTAATATVERADVVGVLTLTGTVTQGARFQIHTDVAGTIVDVAEGIVAVAPEGGEPPATIQAAQGVRIDQMLVSAGDRVVPGMAIAEARSTGFAVTATLDPSALIRFVKPPLGARAQVKGGSGPFECALLDPVPSSPASAGENLAEAQLLCAVPADATVLAGMEATVVIQLERTEDALVLPVEAVAGTVDNGSVYRVGADGDPEEVPVQLGTTDGTRIVIADGLAEGDAVYVPGPWLGRRDG